LQLPNGQEFTPIAGDRQTEAISIRDIAQAYGFHHLVGTVLFAALSQNTLIPDVVGFSLALSQMIIKNLHESDIDGVVCRG